MEYGDNDTLATEQHIEDWVMDKCNTWRDHYESNYAERNEEYYRLWRGIWAAQDSDRKSERSRIISPALQQAVESSVAEIEKLRLVAVNTSVLLMTWTTKTIRTLCT